MVPYDDDLAIGLDRYIERLLRLGIDVHRDVTGAVEVRIERTARSVTRDHDVKTAVPGDDDLAIRLQRKTKPLVIFHGEVGDHDAVAVECAVQCAAGRVSFEHDCPVERLAEGDDLPVRLDGNVVHDEVIGRRHFPRRVERVVERRPIRAEPGDVSSRLRLASDNEFSVGRLDRNGLGAADRIGRLPVRPESCIEGPRLGKSCRSTTDQHACDEDGGLHYGGLH